MMVTMVVMLIRMGMSMMIGYHSRVGHPAPSRSTSDDPAPLHFTSDGPTPTHHLPDL